MKKNLLISTIAASLLLGATMLQAESSGMKDTVAKEEVKALSKPSVKDAVKGEAAAKAKVEETGSKELFKTKEAGQAFSKESAEDEKKKLK